jgi:hypothetical protein
MDPSSFPALETGDTAALVINEFVSDRKIREFLDAYRVWLRRYILFVAPVIIALAFFRNEPIPIGLWAGSYVTLLVFMFGPMSASVAMCGTMIFYALMLVSAALSAPQISTFVTMHPEILPIFALCFGGIAFGMGYWILVAVVYVIAVTMHSLGMVELEIVPTFGVPFPVWLFGALSQGLLYVPVPAYACFFFCVCFLRRDSPGYPIRGTFCWGR